MKLNKEERIEKELQNMEAATGEAELMDELLNLIDEEPIPRLDNDVEIETVLPSTNFRMKFVCFIPYQ